MNFQEGNIHAIDEWKTVSATFETAGLPKLFKKKKAFKHAKIFPQKVTLFS